MPSEPDATPTTCHLDSGVRHLTAVTDTPRASYCVLGGSRGREVDDLGIVFERIGRRRGQGIFEPRTVARLRR